MIIHQPAVADSAIKNFYLFPEHNAPLETWFDAEYFVFFEILKPALDKTKVCQVLHLAPG